MKKRLTTKEFIKKSELIHGNLYNYSNSEYINAKNKIKIVCTIHGEFEQLPHNHMKGIGCIKCGLEKTINSTKSNKKKFTESAIKIHGNKYDYSNVKYKNAHTKIKINCPVHGEFEQTPNSHIYNKRGCAKCVSDFLKYDTKEFIKRAKDIHGDKYDYSLVDYKNSKSKIKIICPEHEIFEQIPSGHIRGYGCIKCKSFKESKGESKIREFLSNNSIEFESQKIFDDCKNINYLLFDFYLPKQNICIEFDGIQHFEPIKYFGGTKKFKETQERDKIKNEYCLKNNIELIRIKYDELIDEYLKILL